MNSKAGSEMKFRATKLMALLCILLMASFTAFGAWVTRGMPAPDLGDPECWNDTTTTLPYAGNIAGGAYTEPYINPGGAPVTDPMLVCPGLYFHFDGTGGGDCDVISSGACSPTCGGGTRCVRDSRNNSTNYTWTAAGDIVMDSQWGWINEFRYFHLPSTSAPTALSSVKVERAENAAAADSAFTHTDDIAYVETAYPTEIPQTVNVHAKLIANSVPVDVGAKMEEANAEIMLADTDSGMMTSPGFVSTDVEYKQPDGSDCSCCKIFTIDGAVGSFGTTVDGLDIINLNGEEDTALGKPGNIKVVTSITNVNEVVGDYAGVAILGGESLLIANQFGGDVLAHELGHSLASLPDLSATGDRNRLMWFANNWTNTWLTAAECAGF